MSSPREPGGRAFLREDTASAEALRWKQVLPPRKSENSQCAWNLWEKSGWGGQQGSAHLRLVGEGDYLDFMLSTIGRVARFVLHFKRSHCSLYGTVDGKSASRKIEIE